MGQNLSCSFCKFRSTKLVPLGTLPNAKKKQSISTVVGPRNSSFHHPSRSSPKWLSVEISNPSSLAIISLGSVQTLSSTKAENTNDEMTPEENKGSSLSSNKHPVVNGDIQEEPERVCKHGIPLTGVIGDPHEVNCVKCERPISRGGRVLAGMLAFRRAKSKQQKNKRLLNKQRLVEEQEKQKRTTKEYDNALRLFAEKHPSND